MIPLQKMGIHPGQASFDHNKEGYICSTMFCGKDHCLSQARKIGLSRFIFLFIVAALLIYSIIRWGFNTGTSLAICQLVLEFLCVFALLKGITKVLPHALIPFMVFVFFQLMGVVFIVLDLIIIVVLPLKEAQYIISASGVTREVIATIHDNIITFKIVSALLAIISIIVLAALTWNFLVVNRCYHYLHDVKNHLKKNREIKPIL